MAVIVGSSAASEEMRVIVLLTTLLCIVRVHHSCPTDCVCYDYAKVVDCSNGNFREVPPDVPEFVEQLNLSNNKITHVNSTNLQRMVNLRKLDLSHNELVIVEEEAFASQANLQFLDLSHNILQFLSKSSFRESSIIKTLNVSHNLLNVIDSELFSGFTYLEELNLENNEISCIEENALATLYSLKTLLLSQNNLVNLYESNIKHLSDLKKLTLSGNRLLCECNLVWLLDWRANHRRVSVDGVSCSSPSRLEGRDLSQLTVTDMWCAQLHDASELCPVRVVCPEKCDCADGIVNCQERGLQEIPRNLPASAREIKLMKNMIKHVPGGVFKHIKNLNRIDLSSNAIASIDHDAFHGLTELTQICLYSNSIRELPEDLLKGLKKLSILLLNSNRISCIPDKFLSEVEEFSLLSFYANNIQSFSNGTIRMKEVGHVHLGENPLICDCNLRWIREEGLIAKETSNAKCTWPLRVEGRLLKSMSADEFTCVGGEESRTKDAGKCFIDLKCPPKCNCSEGTRVDCSNAGFRQIPNNIPRYTTELHLSNNMIERIPADGIFLNMMNLRSLVLTDNLISEIEDGAFYGATELRTVDFSNNDIREIRKEIFQDLPNLQKALFRNNRISCITNDTFSGNKHLELLSFFNNDIRTVEENPFQKLPLLATLNLYSNPLVCNCHMRWLNEWINSLGPRLMVTGNPTCVEPKHLRNIPIFDMRPQDFDCEANRENSCLTTMTCPEECTCLKTSVRCVARLLVDIPENLPPEATELILSDNRIRNINRKSFQNLRHLKILDLSDNAILTIPDNTFSDLIKLESLNLVDNYIKCVGSKAFHGLVSLRFLSLTTNMISQIAEESFEDLHSLTHLYLGDNPLFCDCDLEWLARFIQENGVDGGVAKCYFPERMANQALLFSNLFSFRCETGEPSLDILAKCDPCLLDPCINGGTCSIDDEIEFSCKCPQGFGGRYCENYLSICYTEPCLHGGTCNSVSQSEYWCDCAPGFRGKQCETNIDECANHQCQNNATCVDKVGFYVCQCTPGFTGEFCEEDIDLCSYENNKCQNGAVCSDLVHDYSCLCQPGFAGRNCEVNIDECDGNEFCQNGFCVDGINSFHCACDEGYKGEFCEIPPVVYPMDSKCAYHTCQNDALCYETPGKPEYECKCAPGFQGDRCQHLNTVSISQDDSYVLVTDARMHAYMKAVFTLTPTSDTGILLYHNPDQRQRHLLIQLAKGQVRVSYFLGTTQGVVVESSNYSLTLNQSHMIEVSIQHLKVTLTIDNTFTISGNASQGLADRFESDEPMYIGGLPRNVRNAAAKMYHVFPENSNSFKGCIHEIRFNEKVLNLERNVKMEGVESGCTAKISDQDPCDYASCQNGGTCEALGPVNFRCICPRGFGGPLCNEELDCDVEKTERFYRDDGDCRSTKRIRHMSCPENCGQGFCCHALLQRTITSRFECTNGTKTAPLPVDVVRRCKCEPC
uniref:Slit1 protein n=1 Tax=Isodiametra pulchra TaxID=504439 RepID=A0A2P1DV93_ISOPU|nr:slit1 protein [Isodiametra pulchra]